jgi:glutamyl-tRNA synthetase
MRTLGFTPPRYTHVPLVVAPDGARLEKRTPGVTLHELRDQGVAAEAIVGAMAAGLGLVDRGGPMTAREVAAAAGTGDVAWRRTPWALPSRW